MSTIIAMAYLNWAPDIHLGTGAARHIEEIRRLTSRMKAFTNESERAPFEAQMLYGVHVFARAKVIPDMAIAKGREAHRYAKRSVTEPGVPGGRRDRDGALDLGEPTRPEAWDRSCRGRRDRASEPAPRARRLETWRGGSPTRPRATLRGCVRTWSALCSRPPDPARSPHALRGARPPGCRVGAASVRRRATRS